ncbi:the ARF-like 2 binding protein BART-domain-containing protein [Cladochytrium replicatum]|nr:the ARF-like 2 binding protein BART-domain-containing protein [Cladochytrium replicatum]
MSMAKEASVSDLLPDGHHDEVLEASSHSCTKEDERFDRVVGELEDLLLDESFLRLQRSLLAKYAPHFDDDEENKFVYMDYFKEYMSALDKFIDKRLKKKLSWFSMPKFIASVQSRQDQIDGDVFDVLMSLGDFTAFKETVLSFKQEQEGRSPDLSDLLAVTGTSNMRNT